MGFNTIKYYWREAFVSIGRNSWLSVASVGTVTVSLLILGFFALVVMNANAFAQELESGLEIRVFLEDGLNKDHVNQIRGDLEEMDGVSLVDFVSRDQALAEMKESWEKKDILEGLEKENPLPDGFHVRVTDARVIPSLAEKIELISGVDQVIYGRGLVEKLLNITWSVRVAGGVILLVLGLSAVFLISTTIRMSVYARRKEIGIMVLLGATNWYVRFPFLLEGMVLGFFGALLAAGMVYSGYISLVGRLNEIMPFISMVTDQRTILTVLGGMLGLGILIGVLGSVFSVRRFLKV